MEMYLDPQKLLFGYHRYMYAICIGRQGIPDQDEAVSVKKCSLCGCQCSVYAMSLDPLGRFCDACFKLETKRVLQCLDGEVLEGMVRLEVREKHHPLSEILDEGLVWPKGSCFMEADRVRVDGLAFHRRRLFIFCDYKIYLFDLFKWLAGPSVMKRGDYQQ